MNKPVVIPVGEGISKRQRRNITVMPYVKREREANEAPGRLISKMAGVYVPEPQHQRNDGLKHIPSRGM